jgi:transposase InsO family protein
VHLSLTGRARKASSELSVDHLKSSAGVTKLLEKLDRVFLQDKNWKCFNTYLAFENYRRPKDCSIDEYLSEFDLRHYKLKECDVNLPDAVTACRLIKSCGLSDMHFQLALSTTPKMTFENMRSTLNKLFAESGHLLCGGKTDSEFESVKVEKVEPVFEAEAFYGANRGYGWQRRGGRANFRSASSSSYRPDITRYGANYSDNKMYGANYSERNNPKKPDGSISLCAICCSKMHWAKNCPHAYERKSSSVLYGDEYGYENDEEVQVTLLTAESDMDSKMNSLLGETIGSVLLDSGCSKTVCGEQWLQCFMDTLTDKEKSSVVEQPSTSVYRFGDGRRMNAEKCMVLPCVLVGKNIRIKTDVVKSNIPLLLSRSSMKKAEMILDLNNDSAIVFNTKVSLGTTTMGHYTLPIHRPPTNETISYILLNNVRCMNKIDIASKLHRQFAHPSSEKLRKLLRDAGRDDTELYSAVDQVTESCDTCIRYKKPRPRPVVAFSMGRTFNETVAMDLKVLSNGTYLLVIVDIATRYCTATVIKDKYAKTVVQKLFTNWIVLFGAPRQFLSDNGGEFNNETMRSLADSFGIKLVCTAAESPWSNAVCERLNAILGTSINKIMDDTKCNIDTALSWAVASRNALQNCHGYSPNQLVFGYNPSLPNVYDGDLPMLEKRSSSQVVADNLNAMHSARIDFLKNESNEKIRRALLHQVRTTDVADLVNGDNVYYKRKDRKEWHGPGVVIGQDGKQILVRHGGIYVRVHECRLQHAQHKGVLTVPDDMQANDTLDAPSHTVPQADMNDDDDGCDDVVTVPQQQPVVDNTAADVSEVISPNRNTAVKPTIGKRIECWTKHDGEKFTAKVISRAGKASGIHSHCYNIQRDSSGEVEWIDLVRQVEKWRQLPDEAEVLVSGNDSRTIEAKEAELKNWKDNDVFVEVKDEGQAAISVRWVLTEKVKDGCTRIKARLVARGFEEDMQQRRTDSPTCSRDSLRVAMSVIAAFGWTCNALDVKAAFLQGENINRDVYLYPPREFNNGYLWKLKTTVYGLCDAARAWYFRVKSVLLKMGMVMSTLDQALFFYFSANQLAGIICIHVDDICWAGTGQFASTIIGSLNKQFLIGSTSSGSFKYIGIHLAQEDNCIVLSQTDYINSLEPVKINQPSRGRNDDLTDDERRQYRALIGQLNWVSTQTRPDIAFDVCELSSVFDTARVDDLLRANKVVKKIKAQSVVIKYPKLEGTNQLTIECYSDASFGNLENGGSQGGYLLFITDQHGNKCPVTWQSRRVRRVVKSTLAAETLALLDAAEAGVYIATLLAEAINVPTNSFVVKCFVDNKSLVDALYSTKSIEDKQLRINMAVLRDMLSKHDIQSVCWVQSTRQLANVLTKRGASPGSLLAAVGNGAFSY